MVTYLSSLVQLCCGKGGTLQTNIMACVGSALSVWTTLGLSQLMAHVLSQSTLLRLQIALQGNCPRWALGFVHFPGLSCSGSGSQVPTKARTPMDMHFVPFPGPSSSGDQVLGERTVRGGLCVLITSPVPGAQFPGCNKSTISGVLCVSSGVLVSGCNPPGRCQPSRIPGRLG